MPRARRTASIKNIPTSKEDDSPVLLPIKKEPMDVQDSVGSSKRKRPEKSSTSAGSTEVKSEPLNKKSKTSDKNNGEKKMAVSSVTEKTKTVTEPQTPRRSSRGLIPNKKFQDVDTEEKKLKAKNPDNLIKTPVKEKISAPPKVDAETAKKSVQPTTTFPQTKLPARNNSNDSKTTDLSNVSVTKTKEDTTTSTAKETNEDRSLPSKPTVVLKPPVVEEVSKEPPVEVTKEKVKSTSYNRVSLFKNKYEYTETVVPFHQFKNPTVTNIVRNHHAFKPGLKDNPRPTSTIHKIHSVDKERNTTAYYVYPVPNQSPSDEEVVEVESIVTIETDSVAHTSTESGDSTSKAIPEQEKEGTGTLIKESLALLNPTEQEDDVEYVNEETRKDEAEDDGETVAKTANISESDSRSHRPGKIVKNNEDRKICVKLNEDDEITAGSLRNVVLKIPDTMTPRSFSAKSVTFSPGKNPPVEVILPQKKSEILKVTSKGEVIMSEVTPQSTITNETMTTSTTEAPADSIETIQIKDVCDQRNMKYLNIQEIKIEPREETIGGEVGQLHPAGFISTSTQGNVYKTIQNRSSVGQENQKTQTEELILVELPDGVQVIKKDLKDSESDGADEDGRFQCKLCNYSTDKKANWYKHKTKHIALRNHKCNQCSYRAATSSNLKRHLAIHSDTREYQCALCMLNFRQKIHLERHLKYKHQEKTVACPLCPYLCANENPDLRIHIRRKHMPMDSLSAHMCEECGLVTVSKKDLKQHQKFHKKGPELKFFCESCSFVTDCESRLRRHMFIHTKEKPYQCGLCEYRGSQKEHVLRHMKSQHQVEIERTNRKQNPQPVTMETDPPQEVVISDSSEKADYSSEEKIFACNHCTMKFSKLINLYKHLHAQHKGVMPNSEEEFTCVVCDFRTNNKKNLLVHMRKHNAQDQSPPSHVYSCVLCRYMNPRRRNLFQHMKKKHHIEIVLKQDGTANCYMADATTTRVEVQEQSQGASGEVEIVTESLGINNIISLDEIAMVVSNPLSNTVSTVPVTVTSNTVTASNTSNVNEHEAAEAIEGLQALAEQAGLVETVVDNVIEEPVQDINIEDQQELLIDESELQPKTEEVTEQAGQSIQLTPDQLLNLTSGDYVEINGEMYKVEISSEEKNAAKEMQEITE